MTHESLLVIYVFIHTHTYTKGNMIYVYPCTHLEMYVKVLMTLFYIRTPDIVLYFELVCYLYRHRRVSNVSQ